MQTKYRALESLHSNTTTAPLHSPCIVKPALCTERDQKSTMTPTPTSAESAHRDIDIDAGAKEKLCAAQCILRLATSMGNFERRRDIYTATQDRPMSSQTSN
jgi:hypothetical protein